MVTSYKRTYIYNGGPDFDEFAEQFELWVSLQEGYIEVVPVMANFASQELFNAQKVLYETCELKTEPNRKPLRLAHKNDREDMIMIPEVIIQIISQPEKQCIIG